IGSPLHQLPLSTAGEIGMCDSDIHQGLVENWNLSRRAFVVTGLAAASLSTPGLAAGNVVETDVAVKTPDGSADAALFHPSGKGQWPAVLVWPDILGLRPVFREMGRRLAAEGYVVLVPNPYYRVKPAPVPDEGLDFSVPEQRAKLMELMGALTPDAIERDAAAHVAFLD